MALPQRRPGRWLASVLLLPTLAVAAAAQEIQEVGQVVQAHRSLGTFERQTRALVDNDPVRVGLLISLPWRESWIDLSLDDPVTVAGPGTRTRAYGTIHFAGRDGIGEFAIEKAEREEGTGKPLVWLALTQGALWMALLPSHAHTLWLRTPQLLAKPGGTQFRTLVDPVVGTFLAVEEGEVLVGLPDGASFLVEAGDWILVSPSGSLRRGPAESRPDGFADPPLLDRYDLRTGPPEGVFR
jgi:hypothetical protein